MSATIQCKPNGPYLVKGTVNVKNSRGETVATDAVFALCRCGGSATKPFCDATHRKNGFSDARISDGKDDKLKSYAGRGITVLDNRSICAHAGHCTEGLPATFREEGKPWIDPDGAEVAAVIATIGRCPSGALNYSTNGKVAETPAREPGITVTKDGPYAVVGGVELLEARWAEGATHEHYTLCRCGASKNKPFCDGSHWDAGFKDGA